MKIKNIIYALFLLLPLTSCVGDLNVEPLDPNIETADKVYAVKENYKRSLFKIYSVMAMSGQDGAGSSDIDGLDAGNAQFYRSWWNLQVVPTDEAINSWPDPWVPEINEMKWTETGNEAVEGTYQRAMYMVALVNEYLNQTTDSQMSSRGIEEDFWPTVHGFRSEARFMRALAYYMLMDTYARPPFITESNYTQYPGQISRKELFDWIETELKEIKSELVDPRTPDYYGRADQGVVNALLSRMYLNAEVYTGEARYTDCIAVSKELINSGYDLAPNYSDLFKADNDRAIIAQEIIFPIVYEGTRTQTFGGMHYLIAASRSSKEVSIELDGTNEGWSGNRARASLVRKFEFGNNNSPTANSITDKRGIFLDTDRTLDISDWMKTFETQGWAVYKFTNLKSNGEPGSNASNPDTDIAFFRLGEIYLNYAEAVLRGGAGGDQGTALNYINKLRERGYGNTSGNIQMGDLTLDFLLDERSRELYWEATRRTDLVRYDYFTTSKYLWQFKGGMPQGTSVESFRNIYPLPKSDTSVNGSLEQNPGYAKN